MELQTNADIEIFADHLAEQCVGFQTNNITIKIGMNESNWNMYVTSVNNSISLSGGGTKFLGIAPIKQNTRAGLQFEIYKK